MMTEVDVVQLRVLDDLATALQEDTVKDAVSAILVDVANSARVEWIRQAQETLNSSRRDYIRAIQPVAKQGSGYVISLVGQPAQLIEEGHGSQDMRDWLLGDNVPVREPGQPGPGKFKTKDGGFYRAIPFRHSGPNAGGAAGQAMGSAHAKTMGPKGAKKLGRDIYEQAKSMDVGGKLKDPYMTLGRGSKKVTVPVPKLKEHHSGSIYEGMTKQARGPENSGSMYMTFRMISTNKKEGWIRPATPGVHLAAKVNEHVARVFPDALAAYIEGLSG
jgi:hypothetical protein